MATRKEIIDRTGLNMKVVGEGETLSPSDFNIIANVYDGLHERLRQKNDIYWYDPNDVPLESEGIMVGILSGAVIREGSDFGLDANQVSQFMIMHDAALIELRLLVNDQPSGEPVQTDYF